MNSSRFNRRNISSLEALEARIAPAIIFGVKAGTDNSSAATADKLISFDALTPGTVTTVSLSGFFVGGTTEHLRGIDFRPATGEMYALGIEDGANDIGRIYTVNTTTGALTVLNSGTPFFSTFNSSDDYAFDVNPAADRLRVVGDSGKENIRVNPNNGQLVAQDTDITANTFVDGVAYDRNFDGTPFTTLYGIDTFGASDRTVRIGGIDGNPSPNGGVLTLVGSLGIAVSDVKVGFDIEARTGIGYATMRPTGGVTGLYKIDYLGNGAATLVGAISGNPDFEGMTVSLPDDLTLVNATTAKYIDQDGDNVTVTLTGAAPGASLSKSDFRFSTGQFGSQLKVLDLSAAHSTPAQEWAHASLNINAVPNKTPLRGDSFATVGYINATGVDLGKVTVNGDLGQIDAGDATTNTMGLASLTVQSMGVISNSQFATSGIPNQISDIVGKLGSLTIKSDFIREQINVTGGTTDGSIGVVKIGGDIYGIGLFASSGIKADSSIASVTVGGSIYGGVSANVGSIFAGTSIGAVTVNGSIVGGSASHAGSIESGTTMGAVIIKGSIYGGSDDHSGYVASGTTMASARITGSIVGGTVASEIFAGALRSGTSMGAATVTGNLVGGAAQFDGTVFSGSTIKSVTIGGYAKGGTGNDSGSIEASTSIGAIKIGGDLAGGTGTYSGSIQTFTGASGLGDITSVTIGGSLIGNGGNFTGILASGTLGAVTISGDVRAANAAGVRISGEGKIDDNNAATPAVTAAQATAIKSIKITGSVQNALFLGGYDPNNGNATNADASIGAVTVGGNWITSSIAAGVNDVNLDGFGNADDVKIANGDPVLISKIASITIKGFAAGSYNTPDAYGFIAQQVGLVKVGLRTYTLAAGTDTTGLALGTTGDFIVREVA